MTLDAIEEMLLATLPWSFAAKTLALGIMWWHLTYRTQTVGPVGRRINTSFFAISIMSGLLTWLMIVIWLLVDSGDVHWPGTSILLAALAVWPWWTAWTHLQVFLTYRRTMRDREPAPEWPPKGELTV